MAARLGAGGLDAAAVSILVDGLPVASLPRSTNVVKGDAKSLLIAAAHVAALNRLGPCPEHRRSFGPVAQMELGLR